MKINGRHLKSAVGETVNLIEKEKDLINDINVFPVADGDTGTNLYVTLKRTWESSLDLDDPRANVVSQAIAEASLLHAKGNSGVILSQFFWGFREGVDGKTELGVKDLAVAFSTGAKYAYNAVVNPVEGTMLTVMRETADWATRFVRRFSDVRTFLSNLFKKGVETLERTPELLARIGRPKVIDSGAYGFMLFLEGFIRAVGASINPFRLKKAEKVSKVKNPSRPLFCSNFLVEGADPDLLKSVASKLGDSVVVVGNGRIYKVHLHTDRPDLAEEYFSKVGKVIDRRIERIW